MMWGCQKQPARYRRANAADRAWSAPPLTDGGGASGTSPGVDLGRGAPESGSEARAGGGSQRPGHDTVLQGGKLGCIVLKIWWLFCSRSGFPSVMEGLRSYSERARQDSLGLHLMRGC